MSKLILSTTFTDRCFFFFLWKPFSTDAADFVTQVMCRTLAIPWALWGKRSGVAKWPKMKSRSIALCFRELQQSCHMDQEQAKWFCQPHSQAVPISTRENSRWILTFFFYPFHSSFCPIPSKRSCVQISEVRGVAKIHCAFIFVYSLSVHSIGSERRELS